MRVTRRGFSDRSKVIAGLKAEIKAVDVLIEVLDARCPLQSCNSRLAELSSRPAIQVLNKSDLAEAQKTVAWLSFLRKRASANAGRLTRVVSVVKASSIDSRGILEVEVALGSLASKLYRQLAGKGRAPRPLRAMVVGIPNVGKSSLLNRLVGRRAARIANRPGITTGKQWINLRPDLHVMDTPGVLAPPQANGGEDFFCLRVIGSLNLLPVEIEETVIRLLDVLRTDHPSNWGKLIGGFGLQSDACVDPAALIESWGRQRGLVGPGGEVRRQEAAATLLKEFRQGKFGPCTLEIPPQVSNPPTGDS